MGNIRQMKHGLSRRDISTMHAIFSKYPEVRRVCLFGSRAKGNHARGSDVDLAIMNEGVSNEAAGRIKGELEESSLPYSVDLLNYPDIEHNELRERIKRVGIDFYRISDENRQ
jgi:predicted nucleotidyltransferase